MKMVLEIKKCRNCGKPVTKFEGEWWHYVETGGIVDFPKYGKQDTKTISFHKIWLIDTKTKKCKECGNQVIDYDYCIKPEPFID